MALKRCDGYLEMIRKPEIVVVEEGDVFSASPFHAFVIRTRLLTTVLREVDEVNARIADSFHYLLCVVCARIAYDDQFPILKRRSKQAAYGVLQNVAAVVGRHDDRN